MSSASDIGRWLDQHGFDQTPTKAEYDRMTANRGSLMWSRDLNDRPGRTERTTVTP